MSHRPFARASQRRRPSVHPRRGAALVLVLILSVALGALVLSAIYLASNATLVGKAYEREQDFKYAADAAVAIGKSQLNHDPFALPDTGYTTLVSGGQVLGADGQPVRGLTVNVYAGPSGSTTGQFGRFASVIAEARDTRGARFVRRLELTQESFARFAYWSNRETQQNGDPIFFAGGDVLWGPVWSNDVIQIGTWGGGATFNDEVGTARTIVGKPNGVFRRGFQENQDPIQLPTSRQLDRLPGYAASGRFSFNAPTNGSETSVRMRVEFVALDLNADGDSTDADEGFLRVYTANAAAPGGGTTAPQYLRGDYTPFNCGDWHNVASSGPPVWRFFPAAVHRDAELRATWRNVTAMPNAHRDLGGTRANPDATTADLNNLMGAQSGRTDARWADAGAPAPRCFPGGDPHLAPVERSAWNSATAGALEGGHPLSFTRNGRYGRWEPWTGTTYAPLGAMATVLPVTRRRNADEIATLFPLWRGANSGTMGVVYSNGTVGVSGTLRGKITVYSNANIVVLDDVRYATDPAATDPARQLGRCADVLGLLADRNVVVADNGPLAPRTPTGFGSGRNLDDTPDLFLHAVVMAMQTSFTVENFGSGVTNANGCQGAQSGRGCLALTGGLIQDRRGAVGTSSGSGFIKRYSYDRCAAVNPPPYFPTTGRFMDNRYLELDPVRFDIGRLFRSLTPNY